jgi:acetoin utilization protein AcuC
MPADASPSPTSPNTSAAPDAQALDTEARDTDALDAVAADAIDGAVRPANGATPATGTAAPPAVPVIYHPDYHRYFFGPEHPFSPVRQEMLLELMDALGHDLAPVTPPVATRADVLGVHAETLVEHVEAASEGTPREGCRQYGLDTADVPCFEGMDAAARALVGGTLHAARLIAQGETRRALQFGGGLHHARRDLASGFCVYNDLAVAIRHWRTAKNWRVVYLDIDVHHGDGVQWLFYDDPDVMTISLHESGRYLYPGTGSAHEMGEGAGRGTSVNVPLEPYTQDASFLEAFDRVVPYALSQFQPDALVVQCGADAHFSDPLADLLLTTAAYDTMFRQIFDLADEHTDGRLLLTFGGGYAPDATVRIWALLTLLARGADLPDALPEGWHDRWTYRLDGAVTPTLFDAPRSFDIARADTIEQQNRNVSKRLLDALAPIWY